MDHEAELAVLQTFLEQEGFRTLLFAGEPGIGKTTLREAGVEAADARGMRVLTTRAASAEAQHSFAALIDLFVGMPRKNLVSLPSSQLRAVEVALLRAESTQAAPESQAIALGVLNGLRAIAPDRAARGRTHSTGGSRTRRSRRRSSSR